MNMPVALAVVSDLHVGSRQGLHAPIANVTSRYQRRLWALWLEFVEKFRSSIVDFQGNTDGTVARIVVYNGDIIDLDNRNRSYDYHYTNPIDAHAACVDVMEPLNELADHVFIVRGTPSHVGKSANREEALARDADHAVWCEDNQASWWHLRAKFGGVKFDIKHHASMGRLPWTKYNSANKVATLVQMHAWQAGEQPPDVVIRSHNHQFADSGRGQPTRAILTGAWQLTTEYVHRGEWGPADIQGNIFLCEKGEYTWLPQNYEIPNVTRRRTWPTLEQMTK